jgi:sugar/nucleoside kinase (ribokinase family)
MFLTVGSIIIDDIILPDGTSRMGVLGGGSTHAAMGMRIWSDQVRIASGIGEGDAQAVAQQLGKLFDLQALVHRPLPTPRAWQLFEESGHRHELFRTGFESFRQVAPLPEEISLALLQVRGVHLQVQAPRPFEQWIERLEQAGAGFILWEPWDLFCTAENYPEFCRLARQVGGVSCNLDEGRKLTGLWEPEEIVRRLLGDGARLVSLRMGAAGSLTAAQGQPLFSVPAVPVPKIVDVTGAGNAYCGGLVVGMAETGSYIEASRRAAVSASFALEQFGAVYPIEGTAQKAKQRLSRLKP